MPELPEVETTCSGISPHILNLTAQNIVVRNPSLRWPIPEDFEQSFSGRRIIGVRRRGKYIILETDAPQYALIHLGMSGSLRIVSADVPVKKHDHWDMVFSEDCVLRYNDPRRFGALLSGQGTPESHTLLSRLGPEPLEDSFDADYLFAKSRTRSISIKNFIMDSHTVVGVGNIYAAESLHMAGISPLRACNKVSLKRYSLLTSCIKQVLAAAIKSGGSTLRDYVNGSGQPGYFQQTLQVYGRGGLPCNRCGSKIKDVKIGQRASCYCPKCQR